MTRNFHVFQNFAQFRKGEEVEGVLYPDYFADYSTATPFFFGGGSWMSFVVEAAVSVGMTGAERTAAPNLFGLLFYVGYYDGNDECWVKLQDEHNFETFAFVQELAARANTKVIHYFMGLQSRANL